MKKTLCTFLFITIVTLISAQGQPKQYVFDRAGLLETSQVDSLNSELSELEKTIGSQFAILTIDSLGNETIFEYSMRVFNEWGIGRKEYDDGVLILVSIFDREMRISVGDGLRKIISDETAAKILNEKMVPRFRQEKFFQGLYIGVKEIKSLIESNPSLIGRR